MCVPRIGSSRGKSQRTGTRRFSTWSSVWSVVVVSVLLANTPIGKRSFLERDCMIPWLAVPNKSTKRTRHAGPADSQPSLLPRTTGVYVECASLVKIARDCRFMSDWTCLSFTMFMAARSILHHRLVLPLLCRIGIPLSGIGALAGVTNLTR
jgi:hypothetical protein